MKILKNEFLNAFGPFDHGVWNIKRNSKNINLFHKRSEYLLRKISEVLLSKFTKKELKNKKIIDIGCYDAWLIYHLNKKFNFKKVVGIEPRKKNIDKGIIARKIYNKKNFKVKLIQSDINNFNNKLKKEKFDIVICVGVLHHVSSTIHSVEKICKASRNLVILGSMVIDEPSKNHAKEILHLLNLKDIAYLDKSKSEWAISAFKHETPYVDGSTSYEEIVNVPETRLIKMSLENSGFRVDRVLEPDKKTYNKQIQKLRGIKETLIVAEKKLKKKWVNNAISHEKIFCFELLPKNIIKILIDKIDNKKFFVQNSLSIKKIRKIIFSLKNPLNKKNYNILKQVSENDPQIAILTNIFRAEKDKKNIEIAKGFLVQNKFSLAKKYFLKVTRSDESDWRSFYRSCYFLMIIFRKEKNLKMYKRYSKLLRTSQPFFPLSLNQGIKWLELKLKNNN